MTSNGAVIRYYTGNLFCVGGIVLSFFGIFSTKTDIREGLFGIPAVCIVEFGIVCMIAGLIVLPCRRVRDEILSRWCGK